MKEAIPLLKITSLHLVQRKYGFRFRMHINYYKCGGCTTYLVAPLKMSNYNFLHSTLASKGFFFLFLFIFSFGGERKLIYELGSFLQLLSCLNFPYIS